MNISFNVIKGSRCDLERLHHTVDTLINHWGDNNPQFITINVLLQNMVFEANHSECNINVERFNSAHKALGAIIEYRGESDHVCQFIKNELDLIIMAAFWDDVQEYGG